MERSKDAGEIQTTDTSIMKKTKDELEDFTALTDRLLAVPHSEIKAKLDAEKQAKKAEEI